MAAQLTVRKHSPHHRTAAVHVSACVGLDVKRQQKKSSLEKWSFWIFPIEKNQMEREQEKGGGLKDRGRGGKEEEEEGGGEGEGRWGEWKVPPTLWHTINEVPQAEEMTELESSWHER